MVQRADAWVFPFAAVIFDMDGVIVDTEARYWQDLKAFSDDLELGVSVDELNAQVGQSNQSFYRMLTDWVSRAGKGSTTEDAAHLFAAWSHGRSIDYAALLNPGVPTTLAALHEHGVRTALASSSPLDNIHEVLGACGIDDAFEVIVSGEQFHESKPDPEIYLHTLDSLRLPAHACCCVEDSVPGITAGKQAGLYVVAKREERFGFSQHDADVIIDTIPDLLML